MGSLSKEVHIFQQLGVVGAFHESQNLGIEYRHPGASGAGGIDQWIGSVLGVLTAELYLVRVQSLQRGSVAQLVEQRTENPCVGGSIPPRATILIEYVL